MVACCPFHEENTPSFHIYADHYHCYGCQVHGDAINYVREKKGLGFIEALEFLGQRLGLDCDALRKNTGQKKVWQQKRRQKSSLSPNPRVLSQKPFQPRRALKLINTLKNVVILMNKSRNSNLVLLQPLPKDYLNT